MTTTNNQSITVEHYNAQDVNTAKSDKLMTGSYVVRNPKIFDAIRNSNPQLKDTDDLLLVAHALKVAYNISNPTEELSDMMSRSYNMKETQRQRLSEPASADTTSTVSAIVAKIQDNIKKYEKSHNVVLKKDDVKKSLETSDDFKKLDDKTKKEVYAVLFREEQTISLF